MGKVYLVFSWSSCDQGEQVEAVFTDPDLAKRWAAEAEHTEHAGGFTEAWEVDVYADRARDGLFPWRVQLCQDAGHAWRVVPSAWHIFPGEDDTGQVKLQHRRTSNGDEVIIGYAWARSKDEAIATVRRQAANCCKSCNGSMV